jgi:hypothetical protein
VNPGSDPADIVTLSSTEEKGTDKKIKQKAAIGK